MEMKPYAAFGHVFVKTSLSAGEIMNDIYMKDGVINIEAVNVNNHMLLEGKQFVWFVTKGKHTYTNLSTGDVKTLEPSWCSLSDPIPSGPQRLTVVESSESWCMSEDTLPNLEFVKIEAGESREFTQGTKLYLLDGELQVGNTVFPSKRQIRFSSGSITTLAIQRSLAVIFKS